MQFRRRCDPTGTAMPSSSIAARTRVSAFVLALLGAVTLLAGGPARADEGPRVVTSIKPLHALAAAVMGGHGHLDVLLKGGESPHTYSLRPSDARTLSQADMVFWVGPGLETFLVKPLSTLAGNARVVELMEAPGMAHLPLREGGVWEAHTHGDHDADHGAEHKDHDADHKDHAAEHKDHDHDAHEAEHHDHEHEGDDDMHVWLDPANARAMAAAMAQALAALDPAHADDYRANAARLDGELAALTARLDARLAPVRTVPYIVFHNAYQYFEKRFGLSPAGSITLSPERHPGAKRLSEIRHRMEEAGVACVFTEPQFEPRLVATVVADTKVRTGQLDPLGAGLPDGPGFYARLLDGLADSLVGCLKQGGS